MKNYFDDIKKISVVYFSGTGGTEKVALQLVEQLENIDIEVNLACIGRDFNIVIEDMLILLVPVHAFDVPYPVYSFIKELSMQNKPAVVISVSGGGEVSPNLACRHKVIKKLSKKGFDVVYENMIIMPSNIAIKTPDAIIIKLLEILPFKMTRIVDDLKNNVVRRRKPPISNLILAVVGNFEKVGARLFGKMLRSNKKCTSCGWCSHNCPTNNITMKDGKPKFGYNCSLCMKCMYGCPNNAIAPVIGKFAIIKGGYKLNDYDNNMIMFDEDEYNKAIESKLWKDIKRYVDED